MIGPGDLHVGIGGLGKPLPRVRAAAKGTGIRPHLYVDARRTRNPDPVRTRALKSREAASHPVRLLLEFVELGAGVVTLSHPDDLADPNRKRESARGVAILEQLVSRGDARSPVDVSMNGAHPKMVIATAKRRREYPESVASRRRGE